MAQTNSKTMRRISKQNEDVKQIKRNPMALSLQKNKHKIHQAKKGKGSYRRIKICG
tara:strand:- start:661 stop:828 length:168 start_codon:yes stop_codon:yes gene_type:complete